MSKRLTSLKDFSKLGLNKLQMTKITGGIVPEETPTDGGYREWGETGSGYWSASYTGDCIGSNGVKEYYYIDSTVKWNAC